MGQQRVNDDKGDISDEACPQQDRLIDAEERVNGGTANHSIQLVKVSVIAYASGVTVGGGLATGAPENLRDLRKFSGTDEGGMGLGVRITMLTLCGYGD